MALYAGLLAIIHDSLDPDVHLDLGHVLLLLLADAKDLLEETVVVQSHFVIAREYIVYGRFKPTHIARSRSVVTTLWLLVVRIFD